MGPHLTHSQTECILTRKNCLQTVNQSEKQKYESVAKLQILIPNKIHLAVDDHLPQVLLHWLMWCEVWCCQTLSLHYSRTKAEDLSSIFLQHDKKKEYILYGGRLAWWGSSWWLLVGKATSKQAIITESSEWEFVHGEKGTIELNYALRGIIYVRNYGRNITQDRRHQLPSWCVADFL